MLQEIRAEDFARRCLKDISFPVLSTLSRRSFHMSVKPNPETVILRFHYHNMTTRRSFLRSASTLAVTLPVSGRQMLFFDDRKTELDAHLWVYASRYPPDWDCTPILDEVFGDISAAGFSGIEIMEPILRHKGSVARLNELIQKYALPVSGTSYSGDMWIKDDQRKIVDDVENVMEKLHAVSGKTFGITVSDPQRQKTGEELDAQAELLKN